MNNRIDDETIKKIKDSVDIVDIISSYNINLTGAGKNYFCVCPFHDDHKPSMSVSKEKQIYKCFSCGAGGNVFTFLQEYDNMTFLEAVKTLANRAGIPLNINTKIEKKEKYPDYLEMYSIANKLYMNNLNTTLGKEAKEYLKKRDISIKTIKDFEIGLSLDKRDSLVKLLEKKGFDINKIEQYGLASQNNYGSVDLFHQRIMVPLYDLKGNVIGFSGRIYKDTLENKYLNTRQTVLFKKGELLYNYHRAKESARKKNQIIIVEGYMDVIRLYESGIINVVATMGTAVTKEQINLIRKMANEIILCFDGDRAGEKATLTATDELLNLNIEPKIIRLEDDLDPDEYIRKYGRDKYIQKLNHPINVMEFKLNYLKKDKDLTSSLDTAKYVHEVLEELDKMDDDILKEITIQKVSDEVGLDKDILKDRLKAISRDKPLEIVKEKTKSSKYEKAEQYLLYYLINNEKVMKQYLKNTIYFPTLKYRELARASKQYFEVNGNINISDLMIYLREQDSLKTLLEINSLPLKDECSKEEIDDYFKIIQVYNEQNEIKRLKEELKKTSDIDKKLKISEQILKINKKSKGDE